MSIVARKETAPPEKPPAGTAEKNTQAQQAGLLHEQEEVEQQAAQLVRLYKLKEEKVERETLTKQVRLTQEQEDLKRQSSQWAHAEKTEREKAEKEKTAKQARLAKEQEDRKRQTAQRALLEMIEREKARKAKEQARLARENEERKQQAELPARLEKEKREPAELGLESARKANPESRKITELSRLPELQKVPSREKAEDVAKTRQQKTPVAVKLAAPLSARRVPSSDKPIVISRKPFEPTVQEKITNRNGKPLEARGIVVASLRGDLKLVIAGDTGIKLSVKFREYPISRRNRVLTRAESRREQTVVPLFATTGKEVREAVIETAQEGIYIFSAEPEQGKGSKATFTLKAFESGTRERISALGRRTISGKTYLVKILMPDAIRWDDESAFTGNLEDSESVTKFNTESGLYWREFHN